MFKKFILIIIVFALVIAGLQLFGGRDFGQITLAWDKYRSGGELSSFLSDVGVIFSGDKVKEGALPSSRYANQIMYRWKDEFGVVHVSERRPSVENFEEIRLGDLNYQIEESMTPEEIKRVLKRDVKDD